MIFRRAALPLLARLAWLQDVLISDEEMQSRRAAWKPALPQGSSHYGRGWGMMYSQHVTQADQGCDLDFLHYNAAAPIPEPSIHH